MSANLNCYDNIFGLLTKTDGCIDDTIGTIDYNTSQSGLYLDQLQGLNLKWGNDIDSNNELLEILDNCRDEAVKNFRPELMAKILNFNEYIRTPFYGNVGSKAFTKDLPISENYAGVKLYCADVIDGYFKLKAVGGIFNVTDTIEVKIYDYLSNTALHTFTIQTQAGEYKETTLTTPIELPLSTDDIDNVIYYITYETPFRTPKNNGVTCGCTGSTWCYNETNHCFSNSKVTKDRWRQWLMVGGVKGATIDDLKASTATSYMNGLVLIGELSCDPFNMLCNDFTDFQTQPVPMATALALRYKAGELFIYNILKSNMINRHTMLDREGLMGLKSTYNKKYLELLDYLAQTIDSSDRGCLKCKASQGYNKTSIRL